MIDLYNTFEIQHSLEVDIDAFQRFETEDSEFPQLFTNIDFSAILNDTLRSYLQKSFALDAKYWALKSYQREEYAEQIDQEKQTLMQKVSEINFTKSMYNDYLANKNKIVPMDTTLEKMNIDN